MGSFLSEKSVFYMIFKKMVHIHSAEMTDELIAQVVRDAGFLDLIDKKESMICKKMVHIHSAEMTDELIAQVVRDAGFLDLIDKKESISAFLMEQYS